ncbi:maker489 [Drosophila busckii]|uniref:Maker489 n=1 Tax=Drosophila busckii TaxID=30019 RepID=A0A0M4ECW0_DROBS|nr:maker491 [Drosophila busckii]ALC39522.1 maker489 [Drosophila busckii]
MKSFNVYCDSGWTVIQRRQDGSVSFDRAWDEYREGFGNLRGEFFIGLDKLHKMTNSQPYELFIVLKDFLNETRYASYSNFVIGSETESFILKSLGTFNGNVTNSFDVAVNEKFSTPDRDNDSSRQRHCAQEFHSGWWFHDCYICNLNGRYTHENVEFAGIEWREWHFYPLKFVQMMIRPASLSNSIV